MHRFGQQRIAQVPKYTQLDKLGGAQARSEELHNEDIAKATSTSEKTFGARNLQRTTQGVLDNKDHAVRGVEQQNLAHLEARGDIFRTPGGRDHENLMSMLVKFI